MATKKQRGHELDADDRKALPDSTYAFPATRKEPLNDASHVRNAIARFNQVEGVTEAERREAFARIKKAAKKFGVEMTESRWQDLGGPTSGPKATSSGAKTSGRGRATGGDQTREDLYQEARRKDIKGRSTMTKAQLQRALAG